MNQVIYMNGRNNYESNLLNKWKKILATRVGKKMHQNEYLEYLIKWKYNGLEDTSWFSK